jgi:hypothetical protein
MESQIAKPKDYKKNWSRQNSFHAHFLAQHDAFHYDEHERFYDYVDIEYA